MKDHLSPDKLLSHTIDFLRFPLAIAVIFIHMGSRVIPPSSGTCTVWSIEGVKNILEILFSHVLPHVAVPTFFLISGYLFFVSLRDFT